MHIFSDGTAAAAAAGHIFPLPVRDRNCRRLAMTMLYSANNRCEFIYSFWWKSSFDYSLTKWIMWAVFLSPSLRSRRFARFPHTVQWVMCTRLRLYMVYHVVCMRGRSTEDFKMIQTLSPASLTRYPAHCRRGGIWRKRFEAKIKCTDISRLFGYGKPLSHIRIPISYCMYVIQFSICQ